jgi:hypothetical protein
MYTSVASAIVSLIATLLVFSTNFLIIGVERKLSTDIMRNFLRFFKSF